MTTPWETVRIFISSTFDDMHSERDYLVKQVFPELREWCEKRKLRLVDIDLRWGVKEEDTQNKNVVDVCLRRIDEARPFFLCFLGQRRGWVPREEDISPSTLEADAYPDLKDSIGKASVTEMEILHALVNPFHGSVSKREKSSEYYEPVKYALFYLRDPSYLERLPGDFPALHNIYTNAGIKDKEERAEADLELKKWVEQKIPALCAKDGRPKHQYSVEWNPDSTSPELLLPLACPSLVPDHVRNWQRKWLEAGIELTGTSLDQTNLTRAEEYNHRRSSGRLTGFECEEKPLSRIIIEDLQAAISERYPEHVEIGEVSDLQKELDQQEQFLFSGAEGFIERGGDFDELDAYVEGGSNQLFVLTAPAGMGKSSLLAKWVDRHRVQSVGRENHSIHFRFIGQSDRSTTVHSLLHLLLREIKEVNGKFKEEIPDDPQILRQELPKLLEAVGKQGRTVIVLDALNQLESGLADLAWLPYRLPENIKLIISFKRGDEAAENLLRRMQGQVIPSEVKPFESLNHRQELVNRYLEQYLKQLDQQLLEALINLPGASNPLYLKVLLSELRVFGSFANLGEKIRSDFGETPVSAFLAVLNRLENDPACSAIDPKEAVPLLFGLLAHARHGLSVEELSEIFVQVLNKERQAATDTIHLYLRQVRPFLANRDGRFDFFFESFKLAAVERYASEKTTRTGRTAQAWHQLLAEYFGNKPYWIERTNRLPGQRKVYELPYQQAYAGMVEALSETLTSIAFLDTKLAAYGIDEILEDYGLAVAINDSIGIKFIRDALHLSAHILRIDPDQIVSQIMGRLLGINHPEISRLLEQTANWPDKPWLRPLAACFPQPGGVESFTLAGHIGKVTALAITPDGNLLVSGSEDGTLKVWDLVNGTEHFTLAGHTWGVNALAITRDGRLAVSASEDQTLKVWDLQSGIERSTLHGHTARVNAAAILRGERKVVSASDDKTVKVWDLETGVLLRSLEGHPNYVTVVVPTPDGQMVVSTSGRVTLTGSQDNLKVWDLEKGEECFTLGGHRDGVNSVAITPDGKLAVSAGWDHTLKVWDLQSGAERFTLRGHGSTILAVAITPDGKRAVSTSWDNTLKVWNLEDGSECFTLAGHSDSVNPVVISPDSRLAVSGSHDRTVKVWDLQNGTGLMTFTGLSYWVDILEITPDGKKAVSANGSQIKVWDLENLGEHQNIKGHSQYVSSLAVTPDGKLTVSTSGDQTLKVWNNVDGIERLTLTGHTKPVNVVSITPDGQYAISGSNQNNLKVWDLEAGTERFDLAGRFNWGETTTVAISPDGRRAVSISEDMVNEYNEGLEDYTVKVWDLVDGKLQRELEGHRDILIDLVTSPNGQFGASASQDKSIIIWDLENGCARHTLIDHDGQVNVLAMTPDGQRIVSGSEDHTLKVWDLKSGAEIFTLAGHSEGITAVAITPDGQRIVSGARDKMIKVWDLANGTLCSTLMGHSGEINSLTLTPDGRLLAAASEDMLMIWDLRQGAILMTYKPYVSMCKPEFVLEPFQLIIGDEAGQMHFLVLEGLNLDRGNGKVPFDPPLVTAFRLEEDQPAIAFGCPFCRTWSGISEAELGKEIACPKCRKAVRLNPFSIDGDWRGIARCWMGGG